MRDGILWITPKWPYPADDGAKVATRALLRSLPNRDRLDLFALVGDDETCDANAMTSDYGLTGAVFTATRQGVGTGMTRHLRNLGRMIRYPRMPVTVSRYATPMLKERFRSILADGNYGMVVFDGLHVAALCSDGCKFIPPTGCKIVYRAHNVESQIWQKAAARASGPLKQVLRRQSSLMERFEASVVAKADMVAPVSQDDLRIFESMVPHCSTALTPIGLDFSDSTPEFPETDDLRLVFLGRLDWPPNRDGLQWFLTHVWPHVKRPGARLSIAGVGNCDWLNAQLPMDGVTFLGKVESPDALYAESHAAIVPIFYGGGTRLKMIEPARFARPCISTKAGALGSTLESMHYLHAETESEWLAVIESLTIDECRRVGAVARDRLRTTFDEKSIAAAFAAVLDSLT